MWPRWRRESLSRLQVSRGAVQRAMRRVLTLRRRHPRGDTVAHGARALAVSEASGAQRTAYAAMAPSGKVACFVVRYYPYLGMGSVCTWKAFQLDCKREMWVSWVTCMGVANIQFIANEAEKHKGEPPSGRCKLSCLLALIA